MGKRLTALLLGLVTLVTTTCTGGGAVPAALAQEFTQAPGQSAAIRGEGLHLRFLQVTEDSRCPGDVTCIQAGKASCVIEIGWAGVAAPRQIVITQMGLTE